jgi:class 3 adenylate cyclase
MTGETAPPEDGVFRRLARLVSGLGIDGYPPRTARRLAVVNVVTALVIVAALSYVPPYALYDFEGLAPVIYVIFVQCVFFAVTPWFHRHGDIAAALYFCGVWISFMTFFAYSFGRDSGIHFFFLPGAAAVLLFVGIRHLRLAIALTIAPLAAFLLSQFAFTAPASYIRTDPQLLAAIYVFTVPTAYFFIFIGVYYSFRLAQNAEDALAREHERSERLLGNLLPESIALRLKNAPDKIIADDLGQVTILFADIVDFTPRAASLSAPDLVAFLNRVFTEFDTLAEKHELEKIKTIGDAYMVAAGMPDPRHDHAEAVAEMALDMLDVTRRISAETGESVAVRIGLHTGPAVAGVIGTRKFFYDVWGDTVNTAARMESQGEPGRIQATPEARAALADAFTFEQRGEVEVKGKGGMTTWWLTGRK